MTRISLVHLAHARSGDKGDTANVGLIAYDPAHYDLLRQRVTPEAVKAHFGDMVGEVERFELPNLHALNFLLHNALDGGGTVSLMNDAQGKVYSTALLRMEVEVPEEVADAVRGRGRVPPGDIAAGASDHAGAHVSAETRRANGSSFTEGGGGKGGEAGRQGGPEGGEGRVGRDVGGGDG